VFIKGDDLQHPHLYLGEAMLLNAWRRTGWTTALISERVRYTSERPTVLQWLLFWLATSMKLPGGWDTPVRSLIVIAVVVDVILSEDSILTAAGAVWQSGYSALVTGRAGPCQ
jgi:hypothetical protein